MTRLPIRIVIVVVVGSALVSGPLVGGVDLTTRPPADESPFCKRSGHATVVVQQVPVSSFELRQQDYGARTYFVESEPTVVSVSDVEGCPLVAYILRIPDLGFFSKRVYFLGGGRRSEITNAPTGDASNTDARRNLSLEVVEGSFSPESIDRSTYDGSLEIRVLGDTNRSVYRANLTVQVVE